ncbi:NRPS [Purpureocillium takamizusanense]|uniref:NRPS n=1 Tax=Purpureocillium takamizusanense TaxID=2060973 RepID=A0A9Q8V7L0_9HYPO|nr:NRPS [Purpureocillium takamizusanense]UNI16130.1 NRPS [Purpureocillium takamizusanense]
MLGSNDDVQTVTPQELEGIWKRNSPVPPAVARCAHAIFEQWARSQPSAPAVCAWDGRLSYGELDRKAAALASHLIEVGVGPGTLVPLCFEKSLWTTVAILAVLKVGGAFVLLDPSLPESRLQDIVRQLEATLILTSLPNRPLSSRLVQNVVVVNLDYFDGALGHQAERRLPCPSSSSLAYISFTSGSTGTPKGVMVTHENVASAVCYQMNRLRLTTESRIFDLASYSFSASICNVFHALLAGGCLCVPSDHDRKHRIAESITSFGANVIEITPSIARLLSPEETPTLRLILFSGEATGARDMEIWLGKKAIIAHTYGNTECPFNTNINYNPSSLEYATHIGDAVGAVSWIVNPQNHEELVAPGCVGELLLEGPVVSQGYLNGADKTRAAFIEDPVWLLQGAPGRPGRHGRLYKSGDLVRYNEDGHLVFVGRKDTQVKIRGQRVELGEVEHWLHKYVKSTARTVAEVVVPQGKNAKPLLAAFIQNESNGPGRNGHAVGQNKSDKDHVGLVIYPFAADIQAKISAHLPSYMVPSIIFSIEKLPQTMTGKLDRKRLREIGSSLSVEMLAEMLSSNRGPKRQPSSEILRCIQKIWSQVLDIPTAKIGLDDNFFHLGGDSIAAMKVVGEARKLGINLTVTDCFRYPVLHEHSKHSFHSVPSSSEDFVPFALIGDGVDIPSLLEDLTKACSATPAKISDAYPCTPLQQGLMALTLQRPGEYSMQGVMELSKNIDLERFCAAWERAARTMPILRTRLVQHRQLGLLQVVCDEPVRWVKATGLEEYLSADREDPMGLGRPLVRYGLVKETSEAVAPRWFVWSIHHTLYDGWSMPLLIDEVSRAYRGDAIETPPPFQTFIKYVKEQDNEDSRRYWQDTLSGCEGLTPFPSLPPTIKQPMADQTVEYQLPRPQVRSTDRNVTTSTLVRAAWALLISRMTNCPDVVFGITVSGRSAPVTGVETMAAPTFATVPLRVKPDENQTMWDYVDAVQQQSLDMTPHEQIGLQGIAEMSPDGRQACSFQTLLIIHPPETGTSQEEYGTWQPIRHQQWFNTYAFLIEVYLGDGSLTVKATFDSRVIQPWAVRKLLERLEFVTRQLEDAEAVDKLADIQVMTPHDLEQIWNWNSTLPAPWDVCVHDVFREQAMRRPDAPAVHSWDGQLTYRELDQLSSRLAGRLVQYGVGPDMIVPLLFEKSMWAPAAMLGVLKAGGAFVSIDTCLPEQRIQAIVQQVRSKVVVSSAANLRLSSRLSGTVIELGQDSMRLFDSSARPLPVDVTPSATMFAVFTSGSTGTPKGALLSHRNFCSSLKHQLRALGFNQDSRVFDFASYAFDVAIHNAFAAFASGGCLCIPSEKDRKDNINQVMADMRVTLANVTTSVARLIVPSSVPQLQTLIFGGEAVFIDDVVRWWDKVRVVNAYGPAECGPSTISWEQTSPQDITHIGAGLGLLTWVVDPDNHDILLPPGCVGELLLEGPLVGCGYLNDPAKTAAVFIEDPKWLLRGTATHPGRHGRLYKTGDLVRYSERGMLAYLGRKDTQVKIRGQRVELGEIEHCVQKCMPDATRVVAELITPRGAQSGPVLAAFLEIDAAATTAAEPEHHTAAARILPTPAGTRTRIAEALPAYMVPSAFISMKQLPVTPTGKLNRKQLREIGMAFTMRELSEPQSGRLEVKRPPVTNVERQMQQIWAKVLKIDPVTIGLDDSFAVLGGDSIGMMRMVVEARQAGLELTVVDIVRHPRLCQLAARTDGTSR